MLASKQASVPNNSPRRIAVSEHLLHEVSFACLNCGYNSRQSITGIMATMKFNCKGCGYANKLDTKQTRQVLRSRDGRHALASTSRSQRRQLSRHRPRAGRQSGCGQGEHFSRQRPRAGYRGTVHRGPAERASAGRASSNPRSYPRSQEPDDATRLAVRNTPLGRFGRRQGGPDDLVQRVLVVRRRTRAEPTRHLLSCLRNRCGGQ